MENGNQTWISKSPECETARFIRNSPESKFFLVSFVRINRDPPVMWRRLLKTGRWKQQGPRWRLITGKTSSCSYLSGGLGVVLLVHSHSSHKGKRSSQQRGPIKRAKNRLSFPANTQEKDNLQCLVLPKAVLLSQQIRHSGGIAAASFFLQTLAVKTVLLCSTCSLGMSNEKIEGRFTRFLASCLSVNMFDAASCSVCRNHDMIMVARHV